MTDTTPTRTRWNLPPGGDNADGPRPSDGAITGIDGPDPNVPIKHDASTPTTTDDKPMTAQQFCRLAVDVFYADKPDDYRLSLGHWDTPEPDPMKMTIYTLPRFEADMSVTVGELRRMANT